METRPVAESGDIASARRVLELEARGLGALAEGLGPSFVQAVDLIAEVEGRVVVSGMGKSGHIGRKIAATLASTGTPALYVHPGEASHGDLGMITAKDALLVLSNSGETPELADVIAFARRFAIPLVAIVGRADSALVKGGANQVADAALVLPPIAEACPLGLAPTTSTTMMLALGDAIAVALLERKGFSHDDFRVLHPGGRLGKSLIRVADIMASGEDLPLAAPERPMSEVIIEMTEKSKGCVGIVDQAGRLMGIITDGDLRRHMKDGLLDRSAAEVMTAAPRTIGPHALASEALGRMTRGEPNKVTALFVVEKGRPVGLIHIHDCLRAGVA